MFALFLALLCSVAGAPADVSGRVLAKSAFYSKNGTFEDTTAVVALDENTTVTCSRQTTSGTAICNLLGILHPPTGVTFNEGADLYPNVSPTYESRLVALSSTSVLYCYRAPWDGASQPGVCTKVDVETTSSLDRVLSKGQSVTFETATVDGIEVAPLSAVYHTAIVCWGTYSTRSGNCAVVSFGGGEAAVGSPLTLVPSGSSYAPVIVKGDAMQGPIACYIECSGAVDQQGYCDSMLQGLKCIGLSNIIGSTDLVPTSSVVAVSSQASYVRAHAKGNVGVVCYRDSWSTVECHSMHVAQQQTVVGPALRVNEAGSYVGSVVVLEESSAVVCYEDKTTASDGLGQCTLMSIDGTGRLTEEHQLLVTTDSDENPEFTTTRLTSTSFVVSWISASRNKVKYQLIDLITRRPAPKSWHWAWSWDYGWGFKWLSTTSSSWWSGWSQWDWGWGSPGWAWTYSRRA